MKYYTPVDANYYCQYSKTKKLNVKWDLVNVPFHLLSSSSYKSTQSCYFPVSRQISVSCLFGIVAMLLLYLRVGIDFQLWKCFFFLFERLQVYLFDTNGLSQYLFKKTSISDDKTWWKHCNYLIVD